MRFVFLTGLLLMLVFSLAQQGNTRPFQEEKRPHERRAVASGCNLDAYKAPTESHFVQRNIARVGRPAYPSEAEKAGIEGVVNVDIIVDSTGTVVKACALSGPEGLRKAAEQGALTCQFKKNFGSPHPVRTPYRRDVLPYLFVLKQAQKVDERHYIVVRPRK